MVDPRELVGQTLIGRYRLDSVLGEGAMGIVYRAHNLEADFPVALKVLTAPETRYRTIVRFQREARLAARLRHENVVQVLDFGKWGRENNRLFLAMELVEGLSLSKLLDAGLDCGACCNIVRQVLSALAHVHAHDVLHRDIKPDNILVCRNLDGSLTVKLTDFGIAAALATGVLDDDTERLTMDNALVGTPEYMAPEQCRQDHRPSPAADLYALGVVLYRLLSGRLPFDGDALQIVVAKGTQEPPVLKPRPGLMVPPALAEFCARAISLRQMERFTVAADMDRCLVPFSGPATLGAKRWWELGGRGDFAQGSVTVDSVKGVAVPFDARTRDRGANANPVWGRDAELATMDAFAAEVEGGVGRFLLLTGPSGVGKTALLDEFGRRMAEAGRFVVLRTGYQSSAGVGVGLRYAFERLLGTVGRSSAVVEQAVRDFLLRHDDDDEREAQALVEFLRPGARFESSESVDDPQFRQGTSALVVRMLRRLSRDRPVLLTLGDIAQGGVDVASFVDFALFECNLEPLCLLIVGTLRDGAGDELFLRKLGATARLEGGMRRTLAVGPMDVEVLAQGLVRNEGIPLEQARTLAERSAGFPLYALHLVRAHISSSGGSSGSWSGRSGSSSLPEGLKEILQAGLMRQLERCTQAAVSRSLLSKMSVLGQRVSVDLLLKFVDLDEDQLDLLLDELIAQGILQEAGADDVSFGHGLLRELLLQELTQRQARRLHRQAAELLTQLPTDRRAMGAVGDHWYQAGDLSLAIDAWLEAMRRERSGGDALNGLEWGMKAINEMECEDPRFGATALVVGEIQFDIGRFEKAEALLFNVAAFGDVDIAMAGAETLGQALRVMGRGHEQKALVEFLEQRLPDAGPAGRRAFLRMSADQLAHGGEREQAYLRAREAYEGTPPGPERCRAALLMVRLCIQLGKMSEAVELADLAVDDAGGRGDLRIEALRTLAHAHLCRGETARVLELNSQALLVCRRSGRAGVMAALLTERGDALRRSGRIDEARQAYRDAARSCDELGLAEESVYPKVRLCMCALESGNALAASMAIEGLIILAQEAKAVSALPGLYLMKAWAYLLEGSNQKAVPALKQLEPLDALAIDPDAALMLERIGLLMGAQQIESAVDRDLGRIALENAERMWSVLGDKARRAAQADSALEAPFGSH